MPDSDHLALFIAAGLLLNITPGPDVMFIVSHAMRSGLKAGAVAALLAVRRVLKRLFGAPEGSSMAQ